MNICLFRLFCEDQIETDIFVVKAQKEISFIDTSGAIQPRLTHVLQASTNSTAILSLGKITPV